MIYKDNNKTYLFEGEKDIMKFRKDLQKHPERVILDKDNLIKLGHDKKFRNRKLL